MRTPWRSQPCLRDGELRASREALARGEWRCLSRSILANHNASRYDWIMIKSFRDKDTERLFQRQFLRRFSPDLHRLAWRKLVQIDAAERLDDLRIPPGNRLERLSGDRAGQYSIRINDQWRICFRWQDGDAYDVEVADYH